MISEIKRMELNKLKKNTRYKLMALGLVVTLSLSSYLWQLPKNEFIKKDFSVAEVQYKQLLKTSNDLTQFPRTAKDGLVKTTDVWDWTQGFFSGGLWYIYEYTKKPEWKAAATKWTEALEKAQFLTQHHDIGFVMYNSYGNAMRLEKDPVKLDKYRRILIQSAESALTRFDPKVGLIKSWNAKKSWDNKITWQ